MEENSWPSTCRKFVVGDNLAEEQPGKNVDKIIGSDLSE